MDSVPNVLAERYASPKMREVWSARGKILLEREFWIAVMKAQKELGSDIPGEAISAYEECKDEIDLEDIRKREKITHHDVKARIDLGPRPASRCCHGVRMSSSPGISEKSRSCETRGHFSRRAVAAIHASAEFISRPAARRPGARQDCDLLRGCLGAWGILTA